MSRPQRIIPVVAVGSLLACVTTLAMWLRSEWMSEAIIFSDRDAPEVRPHGHYGTYLISDDGGLILRRVSIWTNDPTQVAAVLGVPTGPHYRSAPSADEPREHQTLAEYLGFEWPVVHPGGPKQIANYWDLRVPYWFVALLFAPVPAYWIWHRADWRRQRRTAAGLCPGCGYDLRGTPERCPECGEDADE